MHSVRTTIFKGCLRIGARGGASAPQPLIDKEGGHLSKPSHYVLRDLVHPYRSPIETTYCVETSVAWKPVLRRK
jgi:hypothetical protein